MNATDMNTPIYGTGEKDEGSSKTCFASANGVSRLVSVFLSDFQASTGA